MTKKADRIAIQNLTHTKQKTRNKIEETMEKTKKFNQRFFPKHELGAFENVSMFLKSHAILFRVLFSNK